MLSSAPPFSVRMHRMMKLVEEISGSGDLLLNGELHSRVHYTVRRFQGMLEGSGLPLPGMHRIEGAIDLSANSDAVALVGAPLSLKLEDGRVLGVDLVDRSGRILSEGHGPSKCLCC